MFTSKKIDVKLTLQQIAKLSPKEGSWNVAEKSLKQNVSTNVKNESIPLTEQNNLIKTCLEQIESVYNDKTDVSKLLHFKILKWLSEKGLTINDKNFSEKQGEDINIIELVVTNYGKGAAKTVVEILKIEKFTLEKIFHDLMCKKNSQGVFSMFGKIVSLADNQADEKDLAVIYAFIKQVIKKLPSNKNDQKPTTKLAEFCSSLNKNLESIKSYLDEDAKKQLGFEKIGISDKVKKAVAASATMDQFAHKLFGWLDNLGKMIALIDTKNLDEKNTYFLIQLLNLTAMQTIKVIKEKNHGQFGFKDENARRKAVVIFCDILSDLSSLNNQKRKSTLFYAIVYFDKTLVRQVIQEDANTEKAEGIQILVAGNKDKSSIIFDVIQFFELELTRQRELSIETLSNFMAFVKHCDKNTQFFSKNLINSNKDALPNDEFTKLITAIKYQYTHIAAMFGEQGKKFDNNPYDYKTNVKDTFAKLAQIKFSLFIQKARQWLQATTLLLETICRLKQNLTLQEKHNVLLILTLIMTEVENKLKDEIKDKSVKWIGIDFTKNDTAEEVKKRCKIIHEKLAEMSKLVSYDSLSNNASVDLNYSSKDIVIQSAEITSALHLLQILLQLDVIQNQSKRFQTFAKVANHPNSVKLQMPLNVDEFLKDMIFDKNAVHKLIFLGDFPTNNESSNGKEFEKILNLLKQNNIRYSFLLGPNNNVQNKPTEIIHYQIEGQNNRVNVLGHNIININQVETLAKKLGISLDFFSNWKESLQTFCLVIEKINRDFAAVQTSDYPQLQFGTGTEKLQEATFNCNFITPKNDDIVVFSPSQAGKIVKPTKSAAPRASSFFDDKEEKTKLTTKEEVSSEKTTVSTFSYGKGD